MPIAIVCRDCGGDNVARDAWAAWDEEHQCWTLNHVFDEAFCFDCDRSTLLEEIELPAAVNHR